MSKLTRYLLVDFLVVFSVAMLLVTFAMCIGAIYKAIDIMSRGLSAELVAQFFLNNIPFTLSYSIPISALFSTLLLFGRLSTDSELSAMKSSGLSVWQVSAPVLLAAMAFSAICLYNNCYVFPKTEYANRKLIKGMGVEDPVKLLDEGRFIRDFPGYMIYIGKKRQNKVRDLIVYDIDKADGSVRRSLRAGSGILTVDKESNKLCIDLTKVRIEQPDPDHPNDATKTVYTSFDTFPLRLSFQELLGARKVSKKRWNMTAPELIHRIRNIKEIYPRLKPEDLAVNRSRDMVHLHQRICLAMAPFTFVLIAIPLGIRSHRKESAAGMLLSLGVMFFYYAFIIVADTLDENPAVYPWLIPWAAIVGAQVVGCILMRRAD